jgi:hypothetical protein
VTTASGNMHSRDNASLSTLVTARLIRVPVTTDTQITTGEYTYCWIECSVVASLEIIKGEQFARRVSRVEAGSNTSTVTLRVIGGDEDGSLEFETVKYGHESHGTRTRK